MPRTLTPNKELLLKAVTSHPGLHMSQLVKLTGVPQWAAQKILPELAGRGLVYYRMEQPNSTRMRKWYCGKLRAGVPPVEEPLSCGGPLR